jgi:hypothetical protein
LLVTVFSTMSQASRPSQDPLAVALRFLPPAGEELREKLIVLLGKREPSTEEFVNTTRSYDPEVVRKVMPTLINNLVDKKSKDLVRASIIRQAVKQLELDHSVDFEWNARYQAWLKGMLPILAKPRTTEKDNELVKRVWGEDYRLALRLELPPAEKRERGRIVNRRRQRLRPNPHRRTRIAKRHQTLPMAKDRRRRRGVRNCENSRR